jgi:hypothetical protein
MQPGLDDEAHRSAACTDTNATSVILDLQKLHATILDSDAYRCRPSVKTILQQLLESGGRPMDNLGRVQRTESMCDTPHALHPPLYDLLVILEVYGSVGDRWEYVVHPLVAASEKSNSSVFE